MSELVSILSIPFAYSYVPSGINPIPPQAGHGPTLELINYELCVFVTLWLELINSMFALPVPPINRLNWNTAPQLGFSQNAIGPAIVFLN